MLLLDKIVFTQKMGLCLLNLKCLQKCRKILSDKCDNMFT